MEELCNFICKRLSDNLTVVPCTGSSEWEIKLPGGSGQLMGN